MNRPVKLLEVIVSLLPIFASILTVYLTMRDVQAKQEIRLEYLEQNYRQVITTQEKNYQMINDKLDKIIERQNDDRLLIERKADRK